jgi:hypothetical protein
MPKRASVTSSMWSPSTWIGIGRPSVERTTASLKAPNASTPLCLAMRAAPESARKVTVGTS